jgi:hypothetical protein
LEYELSKPEYEILTVISIKENGITRLSVCVWGGGTYLVDTMSWNVLEVTWKVGLFVEWVVVDEELLFVH